MTQTLSVCTLALWERDSKRSGDTFQALMADSLTAVRSVGRLEESTRRFEPFRSHINATQCHLQDHRGQKSTWPNRRADPMSDTSKPTFEYDVTEGGVLVSYGAEDGIDLTTPSDHPMVVLANIDRVTDLLTNLIEHGPEILAELARHRAEVGQPCTACSGEGGEEMENTIGWAECRVCGGNRVQAAAA